MLATEFYRHVDTSRAIPFNSPRRADSNETLPDSGTYLPAEISAFSFLLTSIAMRTLRDLLLSIPLDRRIPRDTVPTLSDHWSQGSPFFCLCVPRVSIFKLLATGCYRHAEASRPIPFDSPWRADSKETLPDSAGDLPPEISAFFIQLTAIAMQTLRSL